MCICSLVYRSLRVSSSLHRIMGYGSLKVIGIKTNERTGTFKKTIAVTTLNLIALIKNDGSWLFL
jgi:hypothetical protein